MEVASDPWLGWNPFDPAQRDDLYPRLTRLRSELPIHVTPLGIYRLMRHADILRLLRDVPTGARTSQGTLWGQPPGYVEQRPDQSMLRQDPPHHTRVRKLIGKSFTPRSIERLRARVQAVTDELLDRALEAREFDAVRDLGSPLVAQIFGEMLGVPVADRARCVRWATDAANTFTAPVAGLAPDWAREALDSLESYFHALIAERRGSLGQDLLSLLIRAEEEGERLSFDELVSNATGMLVAGFETTTGLIGNGIRALMHHPGELRRLAADPTLIQSAIEECLRFDGPGVITTRLLREPTKFGDLLIPPDRPVMAVLASANRDPERFVDPERLDVARTQNEHLAFGAGPHGCPGTHLARLEGAVAIGTLVRRAPGLEPLGPHVWSRSPFRVLEQLPVRITQVR